MPFESISQSVDNIHVYDVRMTEGSALILRMVDNMYNGRLVVFVWSPTFHEFVKPKSGRFVQFQQTEKKEEKLCIRYSRQ